MSDISDAELIELDSKGFFPADGETASDFVRRVAGVEKAVEKIDSELKKYGRAEHLDCQLAQSDLIGREVIGEADAITENLFSFRHPAGMGFFQNGKVGLLWGGCTIYSPSEPPVLFFLRRNFSKSKKWWIYRRDELLSHELCHVVRQSIDDPSLEEFFAYRTSFSAFRRWCGDLFNSWIESLIFLLLAMALPVAQFVKAFVLPEFPAQLFFLVFAIFIAVISLRTYQRHKLVERATQKLAEFGVSNPLALLFRLKKAEIRHVVKLKNAKDWQSLIERKSQQSLRWKIIALRFVSSTAEC